MFASCLLLNVALSYLPQNVLFDYHPLQPVKVSELILTEKGSRL